MTTDKKFVLSLIMASILFMYALTSTIVVSIYGADTPAFFSLFTMWAESARSNLVAMLLMLLLFACCSIYFAIDACRKKHFKNKTLMYAHKVIGFALSAYFLYAISSAVGKFIDNLPG